MNRGPDSRFVLEAIIKALISKSSQSSIKKKPNLVHPSSRGGLVRWVVNEKKKKILFTQLTIISPTRVSPSTIIFTSAYTITYSHSSLCWSKGEISGRVPSYFWITIRTWVTPRSLELIGYLYVCQFASNKNLANLLERGNFLWSLGEIIWSPCEKANWFLPMLRLGVDFMKVGG